MDDKEIERELREIKRRLDELEEKVEGRRGLESDVEDIKRQLRGR